MLVSSPSVYVCEKCGCLVADREAHEAREERIDRSVEGPGPYPGASFRSRQESEA